MNIGENYGDLKCIEYIGKNDSYQKIYKMKCIICNREKEMKEYVVKQNKGTCHKSCGQGIKLQNPIFYIRWQSMRTRTTNDNYWATDNYKQRGIHSDEFEFFIDFYDTMYNSFVEHSKLYGEKNTSLERIDVNKPYSTENCTWITIDKQKENQRKVKRFKAISPCGIETIERNVSKFARENNLDSSTIFDVLHKRSNHHRQWFFEYVD